jgi:hypothetical protein
MARRFICRRDAKAMQRPDGTYSPARRYEGDAKFDLPWSMSDVTDHLNGKRTYGHYLLDAESKVKLFCLDVDLNKDPGTWMQRPDLALLGDTHYEPEVIEQWFLENSHAVPTPSPRNDWRDRSHPGRAWYKMQLRTLAEKFSSRISSELGIPTACSYTGNKGIHVYGFTGHIPAAAARAGAEMVLRSFGSFEPKVGEDIFWHDTNLDPSDGYSNYTIEVFPKQDAIPAGGYGNLLRLPMGRNLKNPSDPCFFIDQRREHTTLAPHPDPVALLTNGNPWKD